MSLLQVIGLGTCKPKVSTIYYRWLIKNEGGERCAHTGINVMVLDSVLVRII